MWTNEDTRGELGACPRKLWNKYSISSLKKWTFVEWGGGRTTGPTPPPLGTGLGITQNSGEAFYFFYFLFIHFFLHKVLILEYDCALFPVALVSRSLAGMGGVLTVDVRALPRVNSGVVCTKWNSQWRRRLWFAYSVYRPCSSNWVTVFDRFRNI